MWEEFVENNGPSVAIADLQVQRAREIATYLASGDSVGAELVEARCGPSGDALVVDIYTEVGQLPKVDLRNVERVLIQFDSSDKVWPWVWALRDDFPERLPHTNLMAENSPVCLCVGAEPFVELRRSLTPAKYIERIRTWFADTALGTLHREDQSLEPFISGVGSGVFILPAEFDSVPDGTAAGYGVVLKDDGHFHVVKSPTANLQMGIVVLTTLPKVHGFIRRQPRTLLGLASYVDEVGYDFIAALVDQMNALRGGLGAIRERAPALTILLRTPLTREVGGAPERTEVKAFYASSIDAVADALGLWQLYGAERAPILKEVNRHGADSVAIDQCQVECDLTPSIAGIYNGYPKPLPDFVVIGAGAIGSHIAMGLARSGSIPRAIIDQDFLSPHNLARHTLGGGYVGTAKARALVTEIARLFPGELPSSPIVDDFVSPKERALIDHTVQKSALVLDLSASQAVARALAENNAYPRSMSLFLNPKGKDLILLAEDSGRRVRLDEVEMQYYWTVTEHPDLAEHLALGDFKRYANGCRDRSAIIRESAVSIFSGIGVDAIRSVVSQDAPAAIIWRITRGLGVEAIDVAVKPMLVIKVGSWTCLVSEHALRRMSDLRTGALPRETGGALMGAFDLASRRIYVAGALDAPADSNASETGFTRGLDGLEEEIRRRRDLVNGQLDYVGEWHSHPEGCDSKPSPTDERAYTELSRRMRLAGYPETMLVMSESDVTCIISGEKGGSKWPT